ncbi:NYN domain-containing protein [Novosphingobium mangrovi (ex Huang et al. 2023)]|uniref:NYN domain-containing protein n=1 Tax=Novosphingobium mangrovi (ex Huang et al. 2023) TaxID=2976432 RepID=A0ABT2I8B6_9SPHN|nr:NYN domain-containing protein [Novosphingobium mangrovi (ex Huang et al. 2023)]MCT2400782.1 NYN domain-containing protein [Novosphingobium mangrovi (ex Huang et al. 2023)]
MATPRSHQSRNIALLIDADNASPATLDAALTILGDLGTVNVRRIYGNWSKPALKGWATLVHRHALEPQQQFDLTKGKNATDMKMTIDAMDLLYGGRVDGFGIMSSDSDFMPLTMRIRQNGTPVYGFGSSRTPEAFREACTRFIDLDAMAAEEEEEAKGKVPAKPAVDEELVKLLGDAWRASKRDDDGFASLSEIGQRVANRSSFDARSYGFSRLSELVQSLPNFATEKRESGLFVKRVR